MAQIYVGRLQDGRWLAVAAEKDGEKTTVVTIGTGRTRAEALADCRDDLLAIGYAQAQGSTERRTLH